MAMLMHRAFNSKMLTKLIRHNKAEGNYDDDNVWVPGEATQSFLYGVMLSGNKFSQFEVGEAIRKEDGGERTSDYRSLYLKDTYQVDFNDIIEWRSKYYGVLQKSDESEFGYYSVLLERREEYQP